MKIYGDRYDTELKFWEFITENYPYHNPHNKDEVGFKPNVVNWLPTRVSYQNKDIHTLIEWWQWVCKEHPQKYTLAIRVNSVDEIQLIDKANFDYILVDSRILPPNASEVFHNANFQTKIIIIIDDTEKPEKFENLGVYGVVFSRYFRYACA